MKPKRLAMWGHGRTYTKSKAQFEERLKERLTLRADWFFAYTEGGKSHLLEVGYPAKNISVINNSSPSTLKLRDIYLSTNDIDAFSQSFELAGKRVAVFIGAFSADKRIDFLLDAAQQIQRTIPNFVLVFFGEGPEKSKIVEASKQFPFIKFAHYADLKTLKLIGQVADVILMPGRVGLIAVDSFAIATPIVTTNFGFHAPEFEYLKNEVNCVITHDTLEQYVSGVTDLLQDSSRLTDLSAQCAKDCSNYSIETMASRFHEGVMALLKAPVKSSHK
jgi:glycosyltransferase involved in cell wall biosynthesis